MSTAVNRQLEIYIYRTSEKMPRRYESVIVSGGIAFWDGEDWITQTGAEAGEKIQWAVEWWTPMLRGQTASTIEYNSKR